MKNMSSGLKETIEYIGKLNEPSKEEVSELLKRNYNGEEGLESQIAEAYLKKIYNICMLNEIGENDFGEYLSDSIIYIYRVLKNNRELQERLYSYDSLQLCLYNYIRRRRNKKAKAASKTVSLDKLKENNNDSDVIITSNGYVVPKTNSFEEYMEKADTKDLIDVTLKSDELTPREKEVIRKKYLEDKNVKFVDIAKDLNISPQAVNQYEKSALSKLKTIFSSDGASLSKSPKKEQSDDLEGFSALEIMQLSNLYNEIKHFKKEASRFDKYGNYFVVYSSTPNENKPFWNSSDDDNLYKYITDTSGVKLFYYRIKEAEWEYQEEVLNNSSDDKEYIFPKMYVAGNKDTCSVVITRRSSEYAWNKMQENLERMIKKSRR